MGKSDSVAKGSKKPGKTLTEPAGAAGVYHNDKATNYSPTTQRIRWAAQMHGIPIKAD